MTSSTSETSLQQLASNFQSPGATYRGKPFWCWNGDLDEAELLRQIDVMQEMGMGGFFMHSRTGLVTEYLGDEWFRLINVCADEACKRGMEAWLYDEDRWPSGTAGGLVTANAQYRGRFMCLDIVPGSEFHWTDTLTAAFRCRLDGVAFTDCERIFPTTSQQEFEEYTVLAFRVEVANGTSFFNGNTYVDTLNRDATDYFIELTHNRYKERCGDHLGTSIHGIFTDEPYRGAVFNGLGAEVPDRLRATPWTEKFPAAFEQHFGYDLIGKLPELFLLRDGQAVSQVKWHYMEMLEQMFLDNFARPIYEWCEAHKIKLTGHALHEDTLTAQTAMQGSIMRFYEFEHYPGIDILTEGNRRFNVVKQVVSVARQLGRPWVLSELYGCTGWQMNFAGHKYSGDWQALFGINIRCHHLYWYTMAGEAKRDYPASIGHQSAWWKDYSYVETYFARMAVLLSTGRPACDVLVINPVESLWCRVYAGWAKDHEGLDTEMQAIDTAYLELSEGLLREQIDFDYGDEEMLGRLGAVERDESGPALRLGQAVYRAVVVGRMTTMRASTLGLLSAFREAGGRVIFAGDPPGYVDALPSNGTGALAAKALHLPWDIAAVAAACRTSITNGVSVTDATTGERLHDICCQLRIDGDRRILVAVNVNSERGYTARVRLAGFGVVEEWNCRDGARSRRKYENVGDCTEFVTEFTPFGERAFVLNAESDAAPEQKHEDFGTQLRVDGPYAYELREPNVCVLDFARRRINGGAWEPGLEILQVDRAVREALSLPIRSGEMVQPWFRAKFDSEPGPAAEVSLLFEFEVDMLPNAPLFLAAEQFEDTVITLNGLDVATDVRDGWWVDKAFQKVPVPLDLLKSGPNELVITTAFHEASNLEAVYFLGDFGVTTSGAMATLTKLPSHLMPTNVTTQGLPFYGGPLVYKVPVPGDRGSISFPEFEAAYIKLPASNEDAQVVAWPPYVAEFDSKHVTDGLLDVEVVLTRRNTFGPLHQVPLRADAYGPFSFVTEGDQFSEEYMLYPAGLLQAPVIAVSES